MLQFEVENRAIANRHDVNIHLGNLCKAEIIPSEIVKNTRHSANQNKTVKIYKVHEKIFYLMKKRKS